MNRRLSAVPLAVLAALLVAWPAAAATFTVNTLGDGRGVCPATCTLRAAVNAANASTDASTITVPAGTYTLTGGQLTISRNVSIDGAGATATTIAGGGTARIFSVSAEATLTLTGVTVSGGNATTDTANPYGGNILVLTGGRLFVLAARVTGGSAPSGGGGIALRGGLVAAVAYSVIDNNTTGGAGGGILAEPPAGSAGAGALTMFDSTIAFNTANTGGGLASRSNASAVSLERVTVSDNRSNSVPGGGLYITPAQANFTVKSSIVARNTANVVPNGAAVVIGPSNCAPTAPINSGQNVESGSDCGFTNGSQNADARLATQLATVNGTYVLPLLAGSPAIDRAVDCGTGTQDQTGTPRPVGPACDSGAFEYIPPTPEPHADGHTRSAADRRTGADAGPDRDSHAHPDPGLQQDRRRRTRQRDRARARAQGVEVQSAAGGAGDQGRFDRRRAQGRRDRSPRCPSRVASRRPRSSTTACSRSRSPVGSRR